MEVWDSSQWDCKSQDVKGEASSFIDHTVILVFEDRQIVSLFHIFRGIAPEKHRSIISTI